MRVLLYVQHLSGVGHYVRMHALARALADNHEVLLTDGGRPVSRPGAPLPLLELPRIVRGSEGAVPWGAPRSMVDVMAERGERLAAAVRRLRPQAVLVEHFPFSKRELEEEILALAAVARGAVPDVRVVCSLRDVALPTRFDGPPETWKAGVLTALENHFDALLVHSDPEVIPLERSVPWAGEIPVPVHYTGFVAPEFSASEEPRRRQGGLVVASAGGAEDDGFLLRVLEAWRELKRGGKLPGRRLVLFAPLGRGDSTRESLGRGMAPEDGVQVEPFGPDFEATLARAELSISRAGYNTCAAVLRHAVPALLVPHPQMSDQPLRARVLASRGLARTLDQDAFGAGQLLAWLEVGKQEPAGGTVNLEGASGTVEILERRLAVAEQG